jgi:hypothetical protein
LRGWSAIWKLERGEDASQTVVEHPLGALLDGESRGSPSGIYYKSSLEI